MHPLLRWLDGTSNRTFVVYPIAVTAIEAAVAGGVPRIQWLGVPLLAGGYFLYRLCGRYRTRLGGGGPGLSVPPQRLVTSGPYAFVRNPMYLGHLAFLLGVAVTLRSWFGLALLAGTALWFDRRVRDDEARLRALFGPAYAAYASRVRRWPGMG